IYFYAYNGDIYSHEISAEADDKEGFSTGNAKSDFRYFACEDDDRMPGDLQSLTIAIENFEWNVVDVDIIVLLLASPQSAFDSAFPFPTDATVITVGLNGASAFNAYPGTATVIDDFSQPEAAVINCMIDAAYGGEANPVDLCGAQKQRPPMTILFVNDFTSDYMKEDYSRSVGSIKTSNAIKCPMNMYPDAASEFDFTNSIVQGVSDKVQMGLFYYANTGDMHAPSFYLMDKLTFANGGEFKDYVCFEDEFYPSDLQRLAEILAQITADVLVLFTAGDLSQPLP
ncbi:hypothetical protein PMAYCL1PPCAC_04170, partial [Pristionchus mayeri]